MNDTNAILKVHLNFFMWINFLQIHLYFISGLMIILLLAMETKSLSQSYSRPIF